MSRWVFECLSISFDSCMTLASQEAMKSQYEVCANRLFCPFLLQVIFKVYEEKEQSWQKEYMRLRTQFENSLQVYQKKALQAEERLLQQAQQVRA